MQETRVILNAGIYDLCHRGHLRLLHRMRAAAGADGKLVVVIHDDKSTYLIKGKIPLQTLEHRIKNLEITGLVDEIIISYSTDPAKEFEAAIDAHDGHLITYMRGDDLQKQFPGQWKLEEIGVPIVFLPYTKGVSSTDLRKELEQL